jgi:hypothetical protein
VDSLAAVSGMLDRALTRGIAAAPAIQERLAVQWERGQSGLVTAIERRTEERFLSLTNKLAARQDAERQVIITGAARFEATLRRALAESEVEEDALFSVVEGRGDEREIAQWRRDRENWQVRLDELVAKRDRELAKIASRYTEITRHSFPVAVIFAVPRREAVR